MNIEEKAKRYDEAIDKAKKEFDACGSQDCDAARQVFRLFPELKESEDEEVRKEIYWFFTQPDTVCDKRWLAWLEKQNPIMAKSPQLGEQKPADKIKPKFKVGDWVVENGVNRNPVQITSFEEDKGVGIKVWFSNGTGTWVDYLKGYHKWTIEDARNGDVLFMDNGASNCIFIYKSSNNGIINKYASYNKFGFEGEHYLVLNDGYVIPATKEQRDTLFTKMKEAGYEWDAEKKELKKTSQRMVSAEAKEAMYGKPTAWSEEDEVGLGDAMWAIEQAKTIAKNENDMGNLWYAETWLKSLRDRYTWKPSEQEKAALRTAIHIMTEERNFPKLGAQLQNILNAFEGNSRVDWKPSEKQMEALKEACDEHWEPDGLDPLYTLYQELKKL